MPLDETQGYLAVLPADQTLDLLGLDLPEGLPAAVTVSPVPALPGGAISIAGTGFSTTPGATFVQFRAVGANGASRWATAPATVVPGGTLQVTVPADAIGTTLAIRSADLDGLEVPFALRPAIAGLSRSSAAAGTTLSVVVLGVDPARATLHLADSAGIDLGSALRPARVTPVPGSASIVDFEVPPGLLGRRQLRVGSGAYRSALSTAFDILAPEGPTASVRLTPGTLASSGPLTVTAEFSQALATPPSASLRRPGA